MAGNPDSGKPRIKPGEKIIQLPGMTIRPPRRTVPAVPNHPPIEVKPIPRAKNTPPRLKPIPRGVPHRKGAKRSKKAGMFREDI